MADYRRRVRGKLPGGEHDNPHALFSRIGPLVKSSRVFGAKPELGTKASQRTIPKDFVDECRQALENVRAGLASVDATFDHVLYAGVQLRVKNLEDEAEMKRQRDAFNVAWLEIFPDEDTWPSRTVEFVTRLANKCQVAILIDGYVP